ncbi:UPF0175 family protein [Pedobacter sp. SD-b]|uniref:UPF0175 family protein n=1 Tax=Pedobacter segetis TaxID=2793069 RepID=A0ABS1BGS9_9SPHI|nr:UPF0175 family protein [Pedobacter segetis]MBK0382052.1 UPF0175 family protein [Pedobacter segetis]
MRTITIELPNTIDLSQKEVTTALAAQLYDLGKLSLGQAADLAGYPKSTFTELLSQYKVSIFNYPTDDLKNDLENARGYYRGQ